MSLFIKQKQVRRSRFSSRWTRASLKRREYVASLYTTGVVLAFLVLFLAMLSYRVFVMLNHKFPDSAWYARYGLPLVLFLIALGVLRSLILQIRRAIAVYRTPKSPPKP